jgi:hypothetical protein
VYQLFGRIYFVWFTLCATTLLFADQLPGKSEIRCRLEKSSVGTWDRSKCKNETIGDDQFDFNLQLKLIDGTRLIGISMIRLPSSGTIFR